MTYENFVYWLRGFLELQKPESLSKEQIELINAHINLTLNSVVTKNNNQYKALNDISPLYANIKASEVLNIPPQEFTILNGGSC